MSDLDAKRTVRMDGRGEIDPDVLSWNRARKVPVAEVARRVIDDLSGDVREAAYVGAGEAIQDAR